MGSSTVYLCIFVLLFVLIVGIGTRAYTKSEENFTDILTTGTTVAAIQYEQKKCVPLYNALGNNDVSMPISADFRIKASGTQGSNVCLIKMDDPMFSMGSSNCDMFNSNIYGPQFANVITDVYQGTEIDPDHSSIAGTDVCYFAFKQGADPSGIISFANYVSSNEPSIQGMTGLIQTQGVQLNAWSNNYTQLHGTYQDLQQQLAQAQAGIVTCQATTNTCLADRSAFSNQLFANAAQVGNCTSQLHQAKSSLVGSAPFNPQGSMLKPNYPGFDKCLDIEGISKKKGAYAHVWDCWGGPNQKWTMDNDMRLVSQNSGMCLDLRNGNTRNGTEIVQSPCDDSSQMKWVHDNLGRLRNYKKPSMCLDINNQTHDTSAKGVTRNGNKMMLWPCNGSPSQVWSESQDHHTTPPP